MKSPKRRLKKNFLNSENVERIEVNNSFFEEDANNLFNYLKLKENDPDFVVYNELASPKLKKSQSPYKSPIKKSMDSNMLASEGYDTEKNRNEKYNNNIKDSNKLLALYKLKKEFKNDRFFFDVKPPRVGKKKKFTEEGKNSENGDKDDEDNSNSSKESNSESEHSENNEVKTKEKKTATDQLSRNNLKEDTYQAQQGMGTSEYLINNIFEEDDAIKQIKKKKDIVFFNLKEMNDLKEYKRTKQVPHETYNIPVEKREELLNKAKSKNALVNNNVLLIKPQIYSSQKQINYVNTNTDNKNNLMYMYLMIKKHQDQNKRFDKNDIDFKVKNFENFIERIKEHKYREKLEQGLLEFGDYLANYNADDVPIMEQQNEEDSRSFNDVDSNNVEHRDGKTVNIFQQILESKQIKSHKSANASKANTEKFLQSNAASRQSTKLQKENKEKKISCCERITNFFLGDPKKSYAYQKRVWGSEEHGAFHKDFQDKRTHFRIHERGNRLKILRNLNALNNEEKANVKK